MAVNDLKILDSFCANGVVLAIVTLGLAATIGGGGIGNIGTGVCALPVSQKMPVCSKTVLSQFTMYLLR